MRGNHHPIEFPDEFWLPMPPDTNNITALSPFLVPQDHLAGRGFFYAMAAFMFIVSVLGTLINGLTIACTMKYKKLQSHLNYILVNMAVANLLADVVAFAPTTYCFLVRYVIIGQLWCKIDAFSACVGGMVSLWSLTVIAFERWLVICKPLGNFNFRSNHALAGCVLTWICALCAATPPIFGWSRYIPEGLQCSCAPDWYTTNTKFNSESYAIFLLSFFFAVPFSIIVFCYSQLLFTLKLAAKAQAESASTQKAERDVTRMVVVMVLAFLVCFGPYVCFALWAVTNRGEPFDVRLATIPSVLTKSATVYNPIIYVIFNKQFRSCIRKMLGMRAEDEDESSPSTQSVTEVSKVRPA